MSGLTDGEKAAQEALGHMADALQLLLKFSKEKGDTFSQAADHLRHAISKLRYGRYSSKMTPAQMSQELRRIATAIDASKRPDRRLVARDLNRILTGSS